MGSDCFRVWQKHRTERTQALKYSRMLRCGPRRETMLLLEFLSSWVHLGNGCVRMRLEKAGQSLVQRGPVDSLRENIVDDV